MGLLAVQLSEVAVAVDYSDFDPGGRFEQANPDYRQLTPQQQVMRGVAWAADPSAPAPEGAQWGDWQRAGSATPARGDDVLVGQGGMAGGNPLMGGRDPLGMGMGANPLAMGAGGMFNPLAAGLNPYQAAGLRLTANNKMNAMRQSMANAHRGIGAAGGRDFSRHVENINDEMMALQEQKIQNNINNAFRASQDALAWARFNQSQDQDFWNLLMRYMTARGIYGGAGSAQGGGSPGTFSSTEGGGDTQGTLP